jgi:formylglycine-generating enzyme required for sulfatase activity
MRLNIKLLAIITFCSFSIIASASANSLVVSNGEILNQNSNTNTVAIEFDIDWDNSWRDGVNHDAIWTFLKFSIDDGVTWQHATLALSGSNPNGFSTGSGTALDMHVTGDQKGVFLKRASSGTGSVAADDIQLIWNYGTDGLADELALSALMLKVFALEMVYVPEGSFHAGDYGSSSAGFKQGSSDTDPWFIADSNSISVSNLASNGYYYTSSGYAGENSTGSDFSISAAYPNGYDDFYLMKYEISEGQWVSFFNILTDTQKTNLDITSASGKNTDAIYKRNAIAWTSENAVTTREDRACSYLSWMDGAAFADWAGLRPITELEYEKAARSDSIANAGEYAWGNTALTSATSISGTESGSEVISNSGANSNYNNVTFVGGDGGQGPLRVGVFATTSSNRQRSGAGAYGALDLSGNLSERVVSIGQSQGRQFLGSHGDGNLSSGGYATNSDWPGYSDGVVSSATGAGLRGGSWSDSNLRLRISDRAEASQGLSNRHSRFGFRAARTAP